jgi:apolipoprotein N-acyltransferase
MKSGSGLHLFLLTLLSSVLLPLALPNEFVAGTIGLFGAKPDESFYWGNAVLGVICIAPAFYAICRASSFKVAARLGVVFGGVSTALSSFWLMFFQGFSVWTYGGTILGYMGYNALLFPFLLGITRLNPRLRPFLLAIGWTIYEYFKSIGFLGYPWGLVAYPVGGILPLIQFVDITGVWGLSLLMSLVNALIAEYALARGRMLFRRQGAFVVFLIACAFVYGAWRLSTPIPAASTADLLLVQQNTDPWGGGNGKGTENSLDVNVNMTVGAVAELPRKPDLAVWSESSVSSVGVNVDGTYYPPKNSLVPGIQRGGVPVLFGGIVIVDMNKQAYWNAAVLADQQGTVLDTYGKMHPVPFAESIPFYDLAPVRLFFRNVVGIWNPWVSGTRHTVFKVPLASGIGASSGTATSTSTTMTFGVPICFEDAFADLCRQYLLEGADMLVNITNDSWSRTWSSEIQHFQVARFRAVENRRVLVRSTNGGLSAVVGPWGEIRVRMPFFERTWRDVGVPVYKEKSLTPYTRFGDWFPQLLILLVLIALVIDVLPKKKRPSDLDDLLLFTPGDLS